MFINNVFVNFSQPRNNCVLFVCDENVGKLPCHSLALRTLLEERSLLSEQGSIFLENQLSEQAGLSKQGEYFKNFLEQC